MFRVAAFCLGVCLSASAVARADVSADKTQTLSDAEKEARLKLFVKTGDQARLAGRHSEAVTAYNAALDLQPDPVISGRLGLELVKLGQLDRAGEELYQAVVRGQGVSTQERREVAAAYDKAKALTTWVNVDVSQAGAKITCDGVPWNRQGFSSFWRFAMPGEHTLRATLDGYEEAVETFTAKPGDEITISLKLILLEGPKLPELPAPSATTPHETKPFPPYLPASNIAGDPKYDPHEDPSYGEPKETKPLPKKLGPRFSVNGGVVTVLGVASWNPAVGGVVGVSVKPKEYLSLGLEGRAAWLTTGVAGRQISAMTAGGILSACGHLKWFFGCGLGHVGAIVLELDPSGYKAETDAQFKPGLGGRIGVRKRLGDSFDLGGTFDAMWLRRGTRIVVKETELVSQPPIMLSLQLIGGWEF